MGLEGSVETGLKACEAVLEVQEQVEDYDVGLLGVDADRALVARDGAGERVELSGRKVETIREGEVGHG